MRWRIPFFGHVLLWFLLNLVLLGGVLVGLVRITGRAGMESFLIGQASPQVGSLAAAVQGELRAVPMADWPGVLERFGSAYGVSIYLARPDGRAFDGQAPRWPQEVVRRLASIPTPPALPGNSPNRPGNRLNQRPGLGPDGPPDRTDQGPGPGGPPNRIDQGPGPGGPLDRIDQGPGPGGPDNGPPIRDPGGGPGMDGPGPNGPRGEGDDVPRARVVPRPDDPARVPPPPQIVFLQKVPQDGSYWVAARVVLPQREGVPRVPSQPAFLLVRSATLSAGGLFFDPRPWIWAMLAALGISALIWWPFVHAVTSRLRAVDRAAGRIAEGEFDQVAGTSRVSEIASLSDAVNRMSVRLREFVGGQKRFLGDIAHELCSPLARMEVALGILEQRLGEEGTRALDDVREEVREMSALVNELLSFSKASITGGQVMTEPVELRALVEEASAREALAELSNDVAEEIEVMASPDLLRRALANVFRNIRRHAGNGPAEVTATRHDDEVEIVVADSGPGVPPELADRLFEPFFRVDDSRTRETGGTGLGLAIVQTCLQACGGTVRCRNRSSGGLEVVIRLPGA